MNDYTLYVGIVAGICTAISMLPQLVKIIKEKKADSISFFMLFILLAGIAGWIWYGILIEDYPIIFTNSFSLLVNLSIIFFSIKYKSRKRGKLYQA
jgi:MtN3 and saliva related transmembrane protein